MNRKYNAAEKRHERYVRALAQDTSSPFSAQGVGKQVRAVNELTAANRRLRLEQQTTRATFKEFTNEFRQGIIDGDTYRRRIDDLAAFSLPRLRKELKDLEQQLGRDSLAFQEFEQKVRTAEAQLGSYQSRGLSAQSPETTRFRTQIRGAIADQFGPAGALLRGGGLGGAAAGGAALAGAAAAAEGLRRAERAARDYQTALADLNAIVGFTDSELADLGARAQAEAVRTGASVTDVIESYKLLASQLSDAQQAGVESLTELGAQTLQFAKASGVDLDVATKAVTTSINQFGFSLEDAGRLMDVLAAGSKLGAAEVEDLATIMARAGTSAKGAGIELEELTGAAEVLAQAGIPATKAGTQLRNVILALENDTKKSKAGIEGVSLSSLGFVGALEQLTPLLDDSTQLQKLFGVENANGARILIENVAAVAEYNEGVREAGTVLDQLAARQDASSFEMERAQAAAEVLAITVGDGLTTAMGDLAGSFADTVEAGQLAAEIFGLVNESILEFVGAAELARDVGLPEGFQDYLSNRGGALDSVNPLQIGTPLRRSLEFLRNRLRRALGRDSGPSSPIGIVAPDELDLESIDVGLDTSGDARTNALIRRREQRQREAQAAQRAREQRRQQVESNQLVNSFRDDGFGVGPRVDLGGAERGNFRRSVLRDLEGGRIKTVGAFDAAIGALKGQLSPELQNEEAAKINLIIDRLKEQRQLVVDVTDAQKENAQTLAAFSNALVSNTVSALSEIESVAEGVQAVVGGVLSALGQQLSQFLLQLAAAKQAEALATGAGSLSAFTAGIPLIGAAIGVGAIASRFFNAGGTVHGPSGIDRVPAMLTAGEEVITASQAGRHRAALKAINRGAGVPEIITKLLRQPAIAVPQIEARGVQHFNTGGTAQPFSLDTRRLEQAIREQKVVLPQDTFGTVQNRRARRIQQTAVRP